LNDFACNFLVFSARWCLQERSWGHPCADEEDWKAQTRHRPEEQSRFKEAQRVLILLLFNWITLSSLHTTMQNLSTIILLLLAQLSKMKVSSSFGSFSLLGLVNFGLARGIRSVFWVSFGFKQLSRQSQLSSSTNR
jgi:hypothetical protein